MALQISIKKDKDDTNPKSTMELFLDVDSTGTIELIGIDADGEQWTLCEIEEDGLHLIASIDPNTGWPVDKKGFIKIVREND